jgi:hypothetical protein
MLREIPVGPRDGIVGRVEARKAEILVRYDGTYTDARGRDAIAFLNDGETLRVTIRGVEFSGPDFDGLSAVDGRAEIAGFSLHRGELCDCSFAFDIPIPVIVQGAEVAGRLHVDLVLGAPAPNGNLDREQLKLMLEYNEQRVASPGNSGWFEDELRDIQKQLSNSVFIKACINCLFSDYSFYGHGLFGGMMCFRNIKSEYLQVKSKRDFFAVHGRQDRYVQETYLCPEFARRVAGTGYRG